MYYSCVIYYNPIFTITFNLSYLYIIFAHIKNITTTIISCRRRSDCRLEPEATDCFSINFQVFTDNNQHNFIKIHLKFVGVLKKSIQGVLRFGICFEILIISINLQVTIDFRAY